jgi:hypothetical protein
MVVSNLELLRRLRAFRATGLRWQENARSEEGVIRAEPQWHGCWSTDGTWTILVLKNGDMWLMAGEAEERERGIIAQLCPRGFIHIPIAPPGWRLEAADVASRMRDPFCEFISQAA